MKQPDAPSLRRLPLQYVYNRNNCPSLLDDFYIPVLSAAVKYDRMTLSFNGKSLSVAAAGIAGLINNGGRMRLICNHEIPAEVVQAVQKGLITAENAVLMSMGDNPITEIGPADLEAKHHLALLTWLVKENLLDIKVAIPKHHEVGGHFHRKTSIVTDSHGDKLAFEGSPNESVLAWKYNDESFNAYKSWEQNPYLSPMVEEFERLWENKADSSTVIPIPEALERQLIIYAPEKNPTKHGIPKVKEPQTPYEANAVKREEFWDAVHHAIRTDPQTMVETIAAELWPHQLSFWRRYVRDAEEPPRVLIADEVGLGKTIQAGALLKTFINRGQAERILILTPATSRWQWQEELRHKFNINVPVLDRYGSSLRFVDERTTAICSDKPWRDKARIIMSYDWLRRNTTAFFADDPEYDIVVFDEAHHARYSEVSNPRRKRPNGYLRMLRSLSERTQGLLLLTATPMQIDPTELWALIDVLTRSLWTENEFRQFYDTERPPVLTEWDKARKLWMRNGVPGTPEQIAELARMPSDRVKRQLEYIQSDNPVALRNNMTVERIEESLTMMRRSSEVKRVVSRHTRNLLRQYVQEGQLTQSIPMRDARSIAIEMTPEERKLYRRIKDFVREWYSFQENMNRQALGFVMTSFRVRFSSSRYALQKSLQDLRQRQLDRYDQDVPNWHDLFLPDDDEFEYDPEQEMPDLHLTSKASGMLDEMLAMCQALTSVDSKFNEFLRQMRLLRQDGYDKIMVFSQFWDTQDWLRQELVRQPDEFNLSGLSGQDDWTYDRSTSDFRVESRADVMNSFRDGPDGILLCTETAAESLNFQFCSAIINYDIPWNPMRLEQRIGRIDRIGQKRSLIRIINLFYEGTTEHDAYKAMEDRIGDFVENVGTLQPILNANLERIIRESELNGDDSESVASSVNSLPSVSSFDLDDLAVGATDEEAPTPLLHLNDLSYILNNDEWMPDGYDVEARGEGHWNVTADSGSVADVTTNRIAHDYAAGTVGFFGPGHELFPASSADDNVVQARPRPIEDILKEIGQVYERSH